MNACVYMLINKRRPNCNRFMQLEEPKISENKEGNALILYKINRQFCSLFLNAVSYACTHSYRLTELSA